MPIQFADSTATLTGAVTIDDAEPLLAWLAETPAPEIDLHGCTHLHTAIFQVLAAAAPAVSAEPGDDFLRTWMLPALTAAAAPSPDKDPIA